MKLLALIVFCLLFAASVSAAEPGFAPAQGRSLGELNAMLRAVQAERQAAMSDFARGQELIKAAEHGQLLIEHARRRVEEANQQEAAISKQIEAAKEKAEKDVDAPSQGRP